MASTFSRVSQREQTREVKGDKKEERKEKEE